MEEEDCTAYKCVCTGCHEHVLVGWVGRHKRRCYLKGEHYVHRAALPHGGEVEWEGPIGQTKYRMIDDRDC